MTRNAFLTTGLLIAISGASVGCGGGIQTAIDRSVASGAQGKSYQKDVAPDKSNFGEQQLEKRLGSGAVLHVHVNPYPASTTTYLGIWGTKTYAYRVFAFKVNGDKVEDWGYTLYQPEEGFTHVFGMAMGYDPTPAFEHVKKNYGKLVKSSKDAPIESWE